MLLKKKDVFGGQSALGVHTGFWVSYYYKKKFSTRVLASFLNQRANYKNPIMAPDYFLFFREASFLDLVFGYNFSTILFRNESYVSAHIESWMYVGASYLRESSISYQITPPLPGYFDFLADGRTYENAIRPTAHFQIKYNPIRYIFLGLGGTYHHVGKDFKPVSGNVSLGLQI